MIIAVLRVVATVVAGGGLWQWWRRMPQRHAIRTIVGLGLLARAVAGFVLFWISYLHWPVASSMQLGGGFWFFGIDGAGFFKAAVDAAQGGVWAIARLDPALPSVFFKKTLALLALVFGSTASIALLLNLFSYLGLCALIIRIGQRVQTRPGPLVFALIASSFCPSWILWALQPMKEPFFIMLIAGFLYAFSVWVDGVTAARPSIRACLIAAAWMTCLSYAIAGIRWYFALMLLASSSIVMALVVYQAKARRLRVVATGAALMVALAEMMSFGAGPDLPIWAQKIVRPFARPFASKTKGQNIVESMDRARQSLYRYNGATDIRIVRRSRSVPALKAAPGSAATLGDVPSQQVRFEIVPPTAAIDRMFAGTVAMLVPRWVATRLRWIDMGGGRGLWALADLDTMLFDATLCGALVLAWRQLRSGGVPHALFWHVMLTALVMAGPLVYTALNFGTLFRQRAMIDVCFVLLPLTIGRPSSQPLAAKT